MKTTLIILLAFSIQSCGQSRSEIKREYYSSGKVQIEAGYKLDKLDGAYKTYYEDGNKNSEGTYKENRKEGKWKVWYEDGKKMSISDFKGGKLINLEFWDNNSNKTVDNCNGSFLLKYKNGNPKSNGTYYNCKMHDTWTTWYENGNKESEIKLSFGIPTGTWTYWYEDGSLYKEEIYEGGTKMRERIYNQNSKENSK